ncbi:hypothetical protein JOC70_000730 [Clostridium pascui]|uniref:hypothetical protein n=1 Tax=Clostridium pascui TaxID=46609 RepID=UPI00195E638D|nr:hypothetical protein [Clostridium pascui]MBM7869261.1 hypothetical protein [Clostridium pascui]
MKPDAIDLIIFEQFKELVDLIFPIPNLDLGGIGNNIAGKYIRDWALMYGCGEIVVAFVKRRVAKKQTKLFGLKRNDD